MIDWDVAAVAVKGLLYATCLTAGGGALFLAIFGRQLNEGERRFVIRFTRGAAVAALCVTIARVLVLSGMLGGDVTDMWDLNLIQIILEGSEGWAAVVRGIGLIAIAAASSSASASQAIAVLGAFATAGSFALTGHTGSVGPGNLPRLLVAAHLLAVSYWIGALVPLFRIASGTEHSRVAAILRRFGNIAAVAVPGLIVAGLILLWLLLGSFEAVFTSPYGRLVLIKLAFVAGLLTLATLNKLRLTPAVAAGDRAAVASLRWSIAGEMILAAAILVVTATFTTVVGPPEME
jgi:putative copper resistance protein D